MTLRTVPVECPLPAGAFQGCIPLNYRALESLKMFAPITLAYRLRYIPRPQDFAQSLAAVLFQYPQFTGHLVSLKGNHSIEAGAYPAVVTAVEVPRAVVVDAEHWGGVMRQLPLRPHNLAGQRVFQALLLMSSDATAGCTLMVSFDHGLADATTCAIFMSLWSRLHVSMFGAFPSAGLMEVPGDYDLPTGQSGLACRRFFFRSHQLAGLKDVVNEEGDEEVKVSTNDVLLSVVLCAVLPQEAPTPGPAPPPALVLMMADTRGRSVGPDFMGNGARALYLFLEWEDLLAADLAVLATAVRRAVLAGYADLEARVAAEAQGAGTPPPPAQAPLLEWNSWARAAPALLSADFGAGLAAFEWVNLRLVHDVRAAIVVPAATGGGLALQVTLRGAEMAYLRHLWSTFLLFTPAA